MTSTSARPTSALWTRLSDAKSYEAHDTEFLDRCEKDLDSRTRGFTAFNTRAWLYRRLQRFYWRELDRIKDRQIEAREGRDY